MNTRIVPNLPFATYLADTAYSSSELRLMLEAPTLLWHKRNGEKEDANAAHFIQGRCLHAAVLEHKIDWVVAPETYPSKDGPKPWTYRAKYCSEWRDRQTKDVLTQAQHDEVIAWSNAIKQDEQASQFLNVPGRSELSIFATDPETGLQMRIRIDWCPTHGSANCDVKTALHADPYGFNKAVRERQYFVQGSMYNYVYNLAAAEHGLPPKSEWIYVAVGKGSPHVVQCYRQDPIDLALGDMLVRKALRRIKFCHDNPWAWKLAYPGQTKNEIKTLSLPKYVYESAKLEEDSWMKEGWK